MSPSSDLRRPSELDVPHWARGVVNNYRNELQLPAKITDRMIYARIAELDSHRTEDILEAVRSLLNEV